MESWFLTPVCFLPTTANRERRTGKIPGGFFKDAPGFVQLDAGSQVSFAGSRSLPPMDLDTSMFPFVPDGLKKPGLVDRNLLERDLSALLLRALAVGRRQQSESIGVALDMN